MQYLITNEPFSRVLSQVISSDSSEDMDRKHQIPESEDKKTISEI